MRFIIFERQSGHCYIEIVQAPSLRDALTVYAQKEFDCRVSTAGDVLLGRNCKSEKYVHPLAFIESRCKSTAKYDELQWDDKNDMLLNGSCWEIRLLPENALASDYASVFCSASPHSIREYISLCRQTLKEKYPRSQARAFVWYLGKGPLVTFYTRRSSEEPIEILQRYAIPWQHERYPNAYIMLPDMVEEWNGTYEELMEQLKIEYSF